MTSCDGFGMLCQVIPKGSKARDEIQADGCRGGVGVCPPPIIAAVAAVAAARRGRESGVNVQTGILRLMPARLGLWLALLLLAAIPWALLQGQVVVPVSALHPALLDASHPLHAILFELRLPRVLLAMTVGALLAGAGALCQGLFRNPLADPGLLGVTAGAAAGAASALVIGWAVILAPLACFAALATTVLVYRLGRIGGRLHVTRMLLAGIAVNALLGAWVAFLSTVSSDQQLRNISFWMLGSFNGAVWSSVGWAMLALVALMVFARSCLPALNVLSMGESEARHLGIDVSSLQRRVIAISAFAVGMAVAGAGTIGFIGLIVPHILRLLVGPDYRRLFPLSLLLGALSLLVADVVARQALAPAELPVGVLTALVGAPFFLLLLVRGGRGTW